jgi:hypothetical protein
MKILVFWLGNKTVDAILAIPKLSLSQAESDDLFDVVLLVALVVIMLTVLKLVL